MDKIFRVTVIIILNMLVIFTSVFMVGMIVSVCQQGFIPAGQEMLYGATMLEYLFCLIVTFYIDVKVCSRKS